ncbi:hypothetical protein [Kitasatospora sp. NPDC058478]|uniref:hypothetical protein n=1 Tax=unclassified Kitasatospora TaxID=2633591 RepID=UPI003665B4E2
MSRTKRTGTTTRGGRAAVIGALGLASVALAAGPAFAKGDVEITAPHTARVGTTFTVTGHGDDDGAAYLQVCLEGRSSGSTWERMTCGTVVETGTEAEAVAHVKAAHSGALEYRAALFGLTGPDDHHPVRERTSEPVTVEVR